MLQEQRADFQMLHFLTHLFFISILAHWNDSTCGGPKLVKFEGKPKEITPKARIRSWMGYVFFYLSKADTSHCPPLSFTDADYFSRHLPVY